MRWFYEIGYKYFKMPWDLGPRPELVELVNSGEIKPCRALDLGSGTASNVIFLAQHGFDVTGVDFAKAAVEKGRGMAEEAGVQAAFIQDDLTNLQHLSGDFDLLVDYGTFDDIPGEGKLKYVENILPLTHPGTKFLFYAFEWEPRWWEKSYFSRFALKPGDVEHYFGEYFTIQRIGGTEQPDYKNFFVASSVYFMTRK